MAIKILIGGSPCTYWSIAQKNNRETEASGMGWELFKNYLIAKEKFKPDFFLYENNKSAAQAIKDQISRELGVDLMHINSALVSAQNRQRFYAFNWEVDQPEDRGILLRDVLDGMTDREKGRCVLSSCGSPTTREYFKKDQGTMAFEPVAINTTADGDKARTLMAGYYKYGTATLITNEGFTGGTTAVGEPVRVGALPRPNGELSTSQAFRVYSADGKSVNLTAGGGGAGGKTGLYAIPVEFTGDIPTKAISYADGKTYPVYEVKDGFITIKGKQYPIKLADGFYIIRKLTVSECKRLQTVPEWYEFPVSDTQAYKMLGNGWTVEVIAHLINATQADVLEEEEQISLFK